MCDVPLDRDGGEVLLGLLERLFRRAFRLAFGQKRLGGGREALGDVLRLLVRGLASGFLRHKPRLTCVALLADRLDLLVCRLHGKQRT